MAKTSATPPVARRDYVTTTLHGHTLTDGYGWMRDKESPELVAHLQAENAWTAQEMQETEELQATLYREMLSHIKETDESVPYPRRGWFYYSRTVEGLQYPIHCRRRARDGRYDASEPEIVLLDVNALAESQAFMAVGAMSLSPDDNLLAYSTDNTGYRQYTLRIRDLRTGKDLSDTAERTGSLAWAADSRTLFYTTEDETTKRQNHLLRHTLGEPQTSDVLLREETDERFNLGVGKTRDSRYLVFEAGSHTTSEAWYLDATDPTGSFALIAERVDDQEYTVDHREGLFYIRTNDTGKNFRVVTAPVSSPGRSQWTELIAEQPDAPLEDFDLFRDFCACSRRRLGLTTLEVLRFGPDAALGQPAQIRFPEPAYTAQSHINREFATSVFRYSYQSLVSPASVYEYNVATGDSTLLKQQEIPGGFDRALYASERLWIAAPDGTQIPVSLVYRRDRFRKDGTSPLYIYGYGSYGYPLPIGFSPARLSLLDRGLVIAFAHIRGGGELGDPWHDAGKMMQKRNTFTDFIAAVESLVEQGYGAPHRVAIEGGSAGGLLLGAVVNMRPELFRAVLSHVPFVDVMNTMLDASLPSPSPSTKSGAIPTNPRQASTCCPTRPTTTCAQATTPLCSSRPASTTAR